MVDSARWNAVQRRDPVADGLFVYAVRTTKIYCRPVCKARLARRANISFYTDARDAEDAGYRACKRCRPEAAGPMPEERAVRRVRSMVETELAYPTQVAEQEEAGAHTRGLARRARISKWHFHRTFKRITGLTPAEYNRHQGLARSGGSASGTGGVAGVVDTDTSDHILRGLSNADIIDWATLLGTDYPNDLHDPWLFDDMSHSSAMQNFNIWMDQLNGDSGSDLPIDPHFLASS